MKSNMSRFIIINNDHFTLLNLIDFFRNKFKIIVLYYLNEDHLDFLAYME